jgi:hypothetical protein
MKPLVVDIIRQCAEQEGLASADLIGRCRIKGVDEIRLRAYWACRHLRPDVSFTALAAVFARYHGSVLRGIRAHVRRMAADPCERAASLRVIAALQADVSPLSGRDARLLSAAIAGLDLAAAADHAQIGQAQAALRLATFAAAIVHLTQGGRHGQAA